jgi:hypothetical protein
VPVKPRSPAQPVVTETASLVDDISGEDDDLSEAV